MYRVLLARPAKRFYERADAALQRRLDACFARLAAAPRDYPGVRPLHGLFKGHLRARIGQYRIVYRILDDDRLVIVAVIGHRRDVYR